MEDINIPPDGLGLNLINPYYALKLKERGRIVHNLKIVKNFFIPKEEDLEKIGEALADCETILDVGSGYGLFLNQLAKHLKRKKKTFLGIDTMYWDKKFKMPKPERGVKFEFNGIEAMTSPRFGKKKKEKFDCVTCSWMPHGSDWREMLAKLTKRKIILVLSKDFATGTTATYSGMQKFGFMLQCKAWQSKDSIIQIWDKA